MADNPWASLQNHGALDQKLYQQPKKEQAVPSPTAEPEETVPSPSAKPKKIKVAPKSKKQESNEKKDTQLNAWITASQNNILEQLYLRLRLNGIKMKKGELVGIGIEVLAEILNNYNPKTIDASLLENYIAHEKNKERKT